MAATSMDLAVVRTPSLYVTAKRNGLIKAVRPKLDALRRKGFRLLDQAYRAVLEKAGE